MRTFILALLILLPTTSRAFDVKEDDVYVRVVDTGAGLCTVTKAPGPAYMVYDAGHWIGSHCLRAVRQIIPHNRDIDIFVISHADADHHGQAAAILSNYNVKQIFRTGYPRPKSKTWGKTNKAISEAALDGASIINLQTMNLKPGSKFNLGKASVTFIAGWGRWEGSGPTPSEKRNAISIVMRLEYKGKSVLFTGDTVGRRKTDPDTACKDAEKVMVGRASSIPIASTVIIAPHHGGNNGSSTCFIKAVKPKFVIFPAGSRHKHPTIGAANRYLNQGVLLKNIFRTDRGDDEDREGGNEWDHGRVPNCRDKAGDDDVEILIRPGQPVRVRYRKKPVASGC